MQIAAHVLAYNVNSSLREVINNISPHVDKIFIAYPKRPWKYKLSERSNRQNPTSLNFIIECSKGHNVEIVQGDWEYDEDTRNACFELAKSQGFDWFILQDADEFFDDEGWDLILKELKKSKNETFFNTTWYNFWKSSEFVILNDDGDIKSQKSNLALRCLQNTKYIRSGLPNINTKPKLIDARCYHYGYVRTNLEIETKIKTWTHTNEFDNEAWYSNKWLNWNKNTLNLHPTNPNTWKKAIKFPHAQPNFAKKFNYKIEFKTLSFKEKANNFRYDVKHLPRYLMRKIKNNLKDIINVKFK